MLMLLFGQFTPYNSDEFHNMCSFLGKHTLFANVKDTSLIQFSYRFRHTIARRLMMAQIPIGSSVVFHR